MYGIISGGQEIRTKFRFEYDINAFYVYLVSARQTIDQLFLYPIAYFRPFGIHHDSTQYTCSGGIE